MEKEILLEFKNLLHLVLEGKRTVDDVLSIVLKALDKLEEQENVSDDIAEPRVITTVSED